mgnify:CR=1 FL=1
MIYDHIVKFNGKYYNAGEEVPEKDEPLSFDGAEGLSDEDIVLETDSAVGNKASGRRGRPKKPKQ